jgi:hypothetical protein
MLGVDVMILCRLIQLRLPAHPLLQCMSNPQLLPLQPPFLQLLPPQWRAGLSPFLRAGHRLWTPHTTTLTGTMSAPASAVGCGHSQQQRPVHL